MLFFKQISLSGIAQHLLAPESPVPQHSKSIVNYVEKGINELRQHIIAVNGVESFLGTSVESFSETSYLKKTAEIFSSIVVTHLIEKEPQFSRAVSYVGMLAATSISVTEGSWNFFLEEKLKRSLPNDLDCTGLAIPLVLNNLKAHQLNRLGRLILNNTAKPAADRAIPEGADGILQVYFPENREKLSRSNRIDPCVCVNGIYGLLYLLKEGHVDLEELKENGGIRPSLAYILEHLNTAPDQPFDKITRYYPHPEEFLFFLSRLISEHQHVLDQIYPNFSVTAEAGIEISLKTLLGTRMDSTLPAAMRILVANTLSLPIDLDSEKKLLLDRLAEYDGVLPPEAFFGCGQAKLLFGSPWVTTAFTLSALAFKKEQWYLANAKALLNDVFQSSEISTRKPVSLANEWAPEQHGSWAEALSVADNFISFAFEIPTKSKEEIRAALLEVSAWRNTLKQRSGSIVSENSVEEERQQAPGSLQFLEMIRVLSDKKPRLMKFGGAISTLLTDSLRISTVSDKALFYKNVLSAHFDLWMVLNFDEVKVDPCIQGIIPLDSIFRDLGQLCLIQEELSAFASGKGNVTTNRIVAKAKDSKIPLSEAYTDHLEAYKQLKADFMNQVLLIVKELDTVYQSFSEADSSFEKEINAQKEVLAFCQKLLLGHESYLLKSTI